MTAQVQHAATAFTYAWWLTGDDNAAAGVALAAVGNLPADVDADEELVALLRDVRDRAAPERTMCPAAELALLHDGQAVPLDVAADLVAIPAAEARVELAHGRLEALLDTVTEPFAHPERLGGLAVGNPGDVAHARTCASCEQAQVLLRRGRDELLALAPRPTPAAVLAAGGPAEPATVTPAARAAPEPEPDRVAGAGDRAPQITPAQRRATLVLALVVCLALILLLLAALSGEPPGAQAHVAVLPAFPSFPATL